MGQNQPKMEKETPDKTATIMILPQKSVYYPGEDITGYIIVIAKEPY